MIDVSKNHNLIPVGEGWHYRRRVPQDLLSAFQGRKLIKFSLRTSDLKTARQKRDIEDVKWNEKFHQMRNPGVTYPHQMPSQLSAEETKLACCWLGELRRANCNRTRSWTAFGCPANHNSHREPAFFICAQCYLDFFPKRWQHLQGYKREHEHFDVHDFVKAYAVQRGVATQFLSEDTVSDQQQCRVWWWLSLALYVKAMRTPWVLSGLDSETAYVGLGFSIDQNAERGNHVVLGCSHIYSARGEGLQYRLSKVENPIMRGKNRFMSHDDARRTGETIRQLFFDAHWKLPRRVVLHKRTPFIKDEREGLLEGLSGVEVLDMLEVVHEPTVRYVSSVVRSDGQIDGDNYPVRRGTVLKLDDHTAQLWVHGATAALNPRFKYFQGKRRIPAPLTIRRHAGSSSLETLASEILCLSKMNWNTFDLYTKLPATLQSSGEIAKIGSLLQRFGASSYDYRLFI
jgi:hypothetical protein